jgi:hypothetical protein
MDVNRFEAGRIGMDHHPIPGAAAHFHRFPGSQVSQLSNAGTGVVRNPAALNGACNRAASHQGRNTESGEQ